MVDYDILTGIDCIQYFISVRIRLNSRWECDFENGDFADTDDFLDLLEKGELIADQYTGLKDKNGKEIYEGDIVRIYNMDNRGKIEGAYIPLFDEINGEYVWCKNEDIDSAEYAGFPIWAKYRVIGNIHENPELLEEE